MLNRELWGHLLVQSRPGSDLQPIDLAVSHLKLKFLLFQSHSPVNSSPIQAVFWTMTPCLLPTQTHPRSPPITFQSLVLFLFQDPLRTLASSLLLPPQSQFLRPLLLAPSPLHPLFQTPRSLRPCQPLWGHHARLWGWKWWHHMFPSVQYHFTCHSVLYIPHLFIMLFWLYSTCASVLPWPFLQIIFHPRV